MPTNLYGPEDNFDLASSHVLPALLRKFHEAASRGDDTVEVWGSGNPRREFLHVDDLAAACLFLMERYDSAGWINIGTGTELTIDQAIRMTNRGGKICLAAFPHERVTLDIAQLAKNNIYMYGIRGEGRSATRRAMALMAEKRFDATKVHTHTFPLADLPTALRYARERVDDAIKVVVTNRQAATVASAAE